MTNKQEQPNIPKKFLSPYNPKETEEKLYKQWEESGYFNPDICIKEGIAKADADHFSIILPPPNVTGTLHMGHASMLAIEDTLVRYNRMLGKRTLWLPGTDHASIATQSKVEKLIYKAEKKSRHDLGRETFLKRVEQFAQESHDTIVRQVRAMGSSVDWSREAFTLDKQRAHAVFTSFKNMYDAGLLFRKERIVNWDPKGQTTISDDEIVREDRKAMFYTFKYTKDFPITISTTRPETKLGDTAVAVHPDDKRYKEYIGKEYSFNFMGADITVTIIADEEVDPEFGTGALGVTPAHSQTDWEIAQRHNLPVIQVINEYAKMTAGDEGIINKKVTIAREEIVRRLKEEGLLEKEEEIDQSITTAERTGGIIEPLPKLQWWIDTEKEFVLTYSEINGIQSGDIVTLKKLMRHVVEAGQTEIIPKRFEKTYFHWIDNLRPWCISRQIWYGHRIPVWYKDDEIILSETSPGDEWEQDPDTLDTWFSSGLWTFSTLGWPEKTDDLANYHPTTVLETGYDILFFWVARMILMTTFNLGQIPFKFAYLHGLVRAEDGRKMSKSIGNIIDPIDMIARYGTDATRLSLIIGAQPGNDTKLAEKRIKGYKNFANKIWNITRFILTSIDNADISNKPRLTDTDTKLLEEFERTIDYTTEHLEKFRLDLAADNLYHYIWHKLADIILEESKDILQSDDKEAKLSRQWTLYHILTTSLKLLHPFMPFVTEEIWQSLPETNDEKMLMVAKWPQN